MTTPHAQPSAAATDKVRTVQEFLTSMERKDLETTLSLCAENLVWINHPLTTTKTKAQFAKVIRPMTSGDSVFRVVDMEIHERADGVVVTDRVDILETGGFKMRLPVKGEFVVADGKVTRWVDRFSWTAFILQLARSAPSIVRFRLGRR